MGENLTDTRNIRRTPDEDGSKTFVQGREQLNCYCRHDYEPPSPREQTPSVRAHLTLSIISMFLFFPLGLIAVIFAAIAHCKIGAHHYREALAPAKTAKTFAIIAILIGIVVWFLIFAGVLTFLCLSK